MPIGYTLSFPLKYARLGLQIILDPPQSAFKIKLLVTKPRYYCAIGRFDCSSILLCLWLDHINHSYMRCILRASLKRNPVAMSVRGMEYPINTTFSAANNRLKASDQTRRKIGSFVRAFFNSMGNSIKLTGSKWSFIASRLYWGNILS